MGRIVLAAKVTHVPSIMLSEADDSPLKGTRDEAIWSLRELGRRARERGVDTFVVFDTHWLSNFGYHVNANAQHRGVFTSHEAPQMIRDLRYDLRGDSELATAIAEAAQARSLNVYAHQVPSLGLEYGTIVPMHYMNADGFAQVASLASPLFTSVEESRILGEATRSAIEASDKNVALIASGSLSHRLWPNRNLGPDAWTTIASEFNRQVDLRVLELWKNRRYREFTDMLPDYAVKCNGEAEQLCEYFAASGSGQVSVEFHVAHGRATL